MATDSRNRDATTLLADCRARFLERLCDFARESGFGQPEWLEAMQDEAGAAYDELAGLRDREGFEMARSLTASCISLVHEEDLEFSIVLSDVARRVREQCEHILSRVHTRMARLLDQRDTTSEQCPVGPEAACRGLRGLSDAAQLDGDLRLRLASDNADELAHQLKALYQQLDDRLDAAGLKISSAARSRADQGQRGQPPCEGDQQSASGLAALRQSLLPAGASTMPAQAPASELPPALVTLIHQWIDQHGDGAGGKDASGVDSSQLAAILSPERATAVMAVERVFDAISSNTRLAGALRLSLSRLQIPLLKLALRDDGLFTMADHPANRLMQAMAMACAGIDAGTADESPWCERIDDIAREMQAPDGDIGEALKLALGATQTVIDERMRLICELAADVGEAAQRSERHDICLAAASRAIRAMESEHVPSAVQDFLELYWVQVLARTAYTQGDRSEAHTAQLRTASDLVDSVRPDMEPARRKQLLASLPDLIARLKAGLEMLGLDPKRRDAALGACMDQHSAIIRGKPAPAVKRLKPMGLRLRPISGIANARLLMHGGHVAHEDQPPKWLLALQAGDWLQISTDELGVWHGCCGAIGPQRQIAVLVSANEGERLLVTTRAIAELANHGKAHLLSIPSPLEHAAQLALGDVGAG